MESPFVLRPRFRLRFSCTFSQLCQETFFYNIFTLIQFLNIFKLTSALPVACSASLPFAVQRSFFLSPALSLSFSVVCLPLHTHTLWHYPCNQRNCKSHTHTYTKHSWHKHRESERESELATRNGVGNDAVMAAKSRLLLYYECNCNTQANIAHAVITTVRRYRGEGDSNRTRACGRGTFF